MHWYLHVTCNALTCIGPRLSEGLWRTWTLPSASLLLCLEALASHLPRVTAMLPLFSCAQVRFGNTKTCPNGGHAPACGCCECARRTQSPQVHLGPSLAHVACRTPRQVNAFAVMRLCLALANRCCIWVCEAHWYLHVAFHAVACIDPRLPEGL